MKWKSKDVLSRLGDIQYKHQHACAQCRSLWGIHPVGAEPCEEFKRLGRARQAVMDAWSNAWRLINEASRR